MGDILALVIRLIILILVVLGFTFVPYKFLKANFWNSIKNTVLKILVKIIAVIILLFVEFMIVSSILASIALIEKSGQVCFGITCSPVKL